ncbi:MAG: iron ABC transporter permease [Cyanobacteria bacterium]|nr:iron ABC transporter permease [Cyanobacteriota bacterium]
MTSPHPWFALRLPGLRASWRLDRRVPRAVGLLILLGAIATVIHLTQGDYAMAPPALLETLMDPGGDRDRAFVLGVLRLPRALVAVAVGAALGASGAILQGITRNPLAGPGILGINGGASLAAIAAIAAWPGVGAAQLSLVAFGGGLVTALVIYLLSWQGGSSPTGLILMGIGITALANAVTSFAIAFSDIYAANQAMVWLVGSVYGRGWEQLGPLVGWMAIFGPLACLLGRELDVLALGDDLAQGLGSRVERGRGLLLLCAVALAAAAVATAGAIGFVGLMAPHLARRWVGASHGGLIPVAALVGACTVVGADAISRIWFAAVELPCGIVTAAIGAPYFLWLLRCQGSQSGDRP